MTNELTAVRLSERQRHLINRCFGTQGGSGACFGNICGYDDEIQTVRHLFQEAAAAAVDDTVKLANDQWRVVYDAVHASMYSFGPFEVPIVLGSSLVELADVNLRICIDVWGAYGGLTWEERH